MRGLEKTYGLGDASVNVLKGIDLIISKGETIAILGASGVGKSTLLNIMGALDRPTSGELFFKNESLFKMDSKRLSAFRNKFVGFVFQSHHLLPEFSALENVILPALIGGENREEAIKRGEELLSKVGLASRVTHKPGELSGGEQQRVAIVRSMIQTPEIILADEPTGNLDKKTGDKVFDLLLTLCAENNITLIVVTHNDKIAALMQKRLTIEEGRITEG
ncbi:MAG: ABC transporter ATP-binding protein [Proteobacteria bacterium]|nr:ABC transporter ATP-binding protein [Pseudomonadota bacterium]